MRVAMNNKEARDVVVKKSRNGYGVFAKRGFDDGERIFEVRGKKISCDLEDDIDDETRNNAYRYDENWYISPKGRVADFVNHSCDPNAKVVKSGKKLFIVAIMSIKKGEEILFDYSTVTSSDDIWSMKCNCGERNCRKKIGKFKSLPASIKEKYLALGMVPDFINI